MRYFLIWLLLCLIWGSTWVAIKIGLADIPPIPFCGLRFALAGGVLLGIRVVTGRSLLPPRQPGMWRFLVLGGILNFAVAYGLVFWGEQYVSAGLACLIGTMSPAFTFLFAHLFLANEPLSRLKFGGLLLAVLGVAIIFSDQLHASRGALVGCCALLLSTLSFASFNVWLKIKAVTLEPSLMAGWHMLFGCLPLLAIGIPLSGNPAAYHWTVAATASLLYLALAGSSLAFFLYYYLIRHIAVGTVVTTSLVTPIVALALDHIMLAESPSLTALAGGALILLGVGLIVRPRLQLRT